MGAIDRLQHDDARERHEDESGLDEASTIREKAARQYTEPNGENLDRWTR